MLKMIVICVVLFAFVLLLTVIHLSRLTGWRLLDDCGAFRSICNVSEYSMVTNEHDGME